MYKYVYLIYLTVATSATTASANLWGIDYGGDIYNISLTTGIGTFTAVTTIAGTNSLAANSSGVLFTVGSPKDPPFGIPPALYTVDPASGLTTLVTTLNRLTDCRALAFAPDGTLYAIRDGGQEDWDFLSTINIATGVVTDVGSTNLTGIQSMDFTPSGILYAWGFKGLLRLNTDTGAATDVYPATTASVGFQSIAFHKPGGLYGTDQTALYRLNTNSDASALIGGGNYSDIRGIAFVVPEPSWPIYAKLCLIGLPTRRRNPRLVRG